MLPPNPVSAGFRASQVALHRQNRGQQLIAADVLTVQKLQAYQLLSQVTLEPNRIDSPTVYSMARK